MYYHVRHHHQSLTDRMPAMAAVRVDPARTREEIVGLLDEQSVCTFNV
jgi:hypothetical protein